MAQPPQAQGGSHQPNPQANPSLSVSSPISLKLILPPEELELIRKKKEMELKQAEYRLKMLEAQQRILETQLKQLETQTQMALELINKLKQTLIEKIKEAQVSGIRSYGVVGKVLITPNVALKSGQEVGKGLKLKIDKKGVYVVDTKTKEKLVVALQTDNPKSYVEDIINQVSKAKDLQDITQPQNGQMMINPPNAPNYPLR
jgi:hypothetical protein